MRITRHGQLVCRSGRDDKAIAVVFYWPEIVAQETLCATVRTEA